MTQLSQQTTTLLGIDTALRSTGYAVIAMTGRKFSVVDCGVIRNTKQSSISDCLRRHGSGVEELVKMFKPDVASIEGSFYFKNAKTAMLLGMARGAVVSILARHGIPCYEYAPRKARKIVVGSGSATKQQIAEFMASTLNLDVADIPDDATDAMAMAICHGITMQTGGGLYLTEPI